MAKVRIQARSADARDENEVNGEGETHRSHQHKNVGALEILARVWKREGFIGWYQVSLTVLACNYCNP